MPPKRLKPPVSVLLQGLQLNLLKVPRPLVSGQPPVNG
jgi:hypothetical protein